MSLVICQFAYRLYSFNLWRTTLKTIRRWQCVKQGAGDVSEVVKDEYSMMSRCQGNEKLEFNDDSRA